MYTFSKTIMEDRVFNFIYGCAMHDAILQKAFSGEKKWLGKVIGARTIVKSYIDRVLQGEFCNDDVFTEKEHEKIFLETANAVCKEINTSPLRATEEWFSFGNAQKLINMTVKHVYAHTYSNSSVRECFRYCHCPLDTIMLAKVWKIYKEEFDQKTRDQHLGFSADFQAPWGNEGVENNAQAPLAELPPRYAKFQDAVKALIKKNSGDIFPVEFDYIVWKS